MNAIELERALLSGDAHGVIMAVRAAVAAPEVEGSQRILSELLPRSKRLPLSLAVEKGMRDVVDALIAAGADVNGDDCEGTVLASAIRPLQPALLDRLLEAGADPRRLSGATTTLQLIAGSVNSVGEAIGRPLLQRFIDITPDINVQDDFGTVLHYVFDDGASWVIRELCAAGADPNAVNSKGRTPLHLYVILRRPTLIATVIECGADPEMTDRRGFTPLHFACLGKDTALIDALLHGGANPNTIHRDCPLLRLVAGDGNVDLAERLLRFGADVDLSDSTGLTPLMVAVRLGKIAVVNLLLQSGARKDLRDRAGRAAIDFVNEITDFRLRHKIISLVRE